MQARKIGKDIENRALFYDKDLGHSLQSEMKGHLGNLSKRIKSKDARTTGSVERKAWLLRGKLVLCLGAHSECYSRRKISQGISVVSAFSGAELRAPSQLSDLGALCIMAVTK